MSNMTRRLTMTIQVQPFVSETDGDATYGTAVTYPCHIDYSANRVLNARGEEVTSIATVYLEAEVTARDRFTLPDATGEITADSIARTAIKVVSVYDPLKAGAFHHCEVML